MFTFQSAGVFKASFNAWREATDDHKTVAAMVHLLEDEGFPFTIYDRNVDGVITEDELTIMGISNFGDFGGVNRHGPDGGCTTLRRTVVLLWKLIVPLRVCGPLFWWIKRDSRLLLMNLHIGSG